jgi:hypothetical protein
MSGMARMSPHTNPHPERPDDAPWHAGDVACAEDAKAKTKAIAMSLIIVSPFGPIPMTIFGATFEPALAATFIEGVELRSYFVTFGGVGGANTCNGTVSDANTALPRTRFSVSNSANQRALRLIGRAPALST